MEESAVNFLIKILFGKAPKPAREARALPNPNSAICARYFFPARV
jgi:hypothetical protein